MQRKQWNVIDVYADRRLFSGIRRRDTDAFKIGVISGKIGGRMNFVINGDKGRPTIFFIVVKFGGSGAC